MELQPKFRELGDNQSQADTESFLGECDRKQRRYPSAEQHYNTAMDLYKGLNYTFGVAECNWSLGLIQQAIDNLGQARAFLDEARCQYASMGSMGDVASCLASLAKIDIAEGEVDAAKSKFTEASEIFRELEDTPEQDWCYAEIKKLEEG